MFKSTRWTLLAFALTAPLAACSGESDPDTDGDPMDPDPMDPAPSGPIYSGGCDAIELDEPDDGIQLQIPISVPVGEEREFCQLVMVEESVNLNWSEGLFTTGSHHALINQTSYNGEIPTVMVDGIEFEGDPTQAHPCMTPSALWDVGGVIAGGRNVAHRDQPDTTTGGAKGVLPDNVATRIEAGDVLVVNFHMINGRDEDLDSCYKVNLHGIPDEQVEQEAGGFFLYNPFITVPSMGTASARMACPVTQDVTLVTAVSHMHQRGVGSEAFLWDSNPTDPEAQQVRQFYDIDEWEEPNMVRFDEPLQLTAGQWIDWSCEYDNPEPRDVAQGFASTDEMCMFLGVYYPRNVEMEQCGRATGGVNLPDGTKNGQEFLDCLIASPQVFQGAFDDPDRYESLKCFTDTCTKVAPVVSPFLDCVTTNGDPTLCTTEMAALQAATCD